MSESEMDGKYPENLQGAIWPAKQSHPYNRVTQKVHSIWLKLAV